MASASTWKDLLIAAWRAARRMARPDLPLAFALFAGVFCGLAAFPLGQDIADCVGDYVRKSAQTSPPEKPTTPLLPPDAWGPTMLVVAALFAVLAYLWIRGNREQGISRGRILGATVTFETGVGETTAQRETCEVTVHPRMITDKRHPPPPRIYVCSPRSDRRFELLWEPDTGLYRGTCDQRAFHDDIVDAMSTSPEVSRAVVEFVGRHFVSVNLRNADGEIDCQPIAVCIGFQLKHDPIRDGYPLVGADTHNAEQQTAPAPIDSVNDAVNDPTSAPS